jgi:hypothetical protein
VAQDAKLYYRTSLFNFHEVILFYSVPHTRYHKKFSVVVSTGIVTCSGQEACTISHCILYTSMLKPFVETNLFSNSPSDSQTHHSCHTNYHCPRVAFDCLKCLQALWQTLSIVAQHHTCLRRLPATLQFRMHADQDLAPPGFD